MLTDEAANRRIAERLLIKSGVPKHNITLLDSGEAALTHFQTLQDAPQTQVPSLVLLDIQMGVVSGLDVMRVCGERGWVLPPVLACTSYVTGEDKAEYERLGFSGLLGKPFSVKDLKSTLQAVSASLRPSAAAGRLTSFVCVT